MMDSTDNSISLSQYLYFVSYILKLNLREMLNFECKDDECFIFIKHNNTRMPENGIHYEDAISYLTKNQQNATENEQIANDVRLLKEPHVDFS